MKKLLVLLIYSTVRVALSEMDMKDSFILVIYAALGVALTVVMVHTALSAEGTDWVMENATKVDSY